MTQVNGTSELMTQIHAPDSDLMRQDTRQTDAPRCLWLYVA